MSRIQRTRVLSTVVVLLAAAGMAAAIEGPQGVSPGSLDRVAAMRDGCTTFSWQALEGVVSYELVAYELTDEAGSDAETASELVNEVLFVRLPGGVTSWTPEVADCLNPGGRYAWYVRAVLDAETGEATEWSAPLLFTVPATPSLVEVEQALDVLLRYVEEDGETDGRTRGGSDRREVADLARSAGAKAAGRSVQTGTAAIRGEQPDLSGETYGVVGTSASPDGAGLGAANTAGGPDLVLDGSAVGAADAELSESGIDRPSASPQIFSIGNSSGGGMTLNVDGVEVVTTATDQDTVGALSCAPDEIAKFIGGVWVCAPDVDTNTDTLGSLMCASGEVAEWDGHHWACDPDDDTLADLVCPRGYIAKWNDTSWACAPDEDTVYPAGRGLMFDNGRITLDPAWFSTSIVTLDGPGLIGTETSLAIGSDGLPLIVYTDPTNLSLKVAHCVDAFCSAATINVLDDGGGGAVGSPCSLAIGSDGLGLAAYYDETNGDLRVAHCEDLLCSSATVTAIGSPYDVGTGASVAIGGDGYGLISHYDQTNGYLRVAHCTNTNCTGFSVSIVDSPGAVGLFTSLAIGVDGLGLIAYYDDTNDDLKVAHCEDAACTTSTITILDSTGSGRPSVAIGSDGFGLILYQRSVGSTVAHCNNDACSSRQVNTPDLGESLGCTSLVVGDDGRGVMGCVPSIVPIAVKVGRCDDAYCMYGSLSPADPYAGQPYGFSLALGADGLPIMSYLVHGSNNELRVAHLPYGY